MLAIKFQRIGKRRHPYYRIVVAEKRSKMIAPPVEQVGFYNPLTKEAAFEGDKVKHWISVGAKPTVTVHNLLVKQGIVSGPKIRIKIPAKKAEAAPVAQAVPATQEPAEKPQQETAPVAAPASVSQEVAPAAAEKEAGGAAAA